MKTLLLSVMVIFFCSLICAEDKVATTVDKTLDPLYYAINFDNIAAKRKPLFRKDRKGDVPEQIWKIKTNGTVTAPLNMFEGKLLIGTSTGNFNYIHLKDGAVDKKNCAAGGMLVWTGIQNNNKIIGMTWVGTVVSYAIDWPTFMKTSYGGWKGRDIQPVGALVWMAGAIVTRRENFPVMLEMVEGTVVSTPTKTWSNGEATAPLINSGEVFWLATSKGELLSIDQKLTTVTSTIRIGKSYATALASDGASIFALTASKELLAYDIKSNTLKWQIKVDGNGVDSMVCEKGRLYVNSGSFYIVDTEDGKIIFQKESFAYEKFMRTKPFLTNTRVYSCDSEGNIFIINKKDNQVLQVINLDEDVMVDFLVDKNILYISTIAGSLFALDVSLY